MIPNAILGRYARSLADIASEGNLEEKVTEDLKTYSEIFRTVPGVLEALHSPAVPREIQEKLLDALMARYPVTPITSNFLRLLLRHNRIGFFRQILDDFLKSVQELKGIVSAKVTAAAPLSAQEEKSLKDQLAGLTGKPVILEMQTDANLLGGIAVQIGSTVFDGSVQTQLAELRRRFVEA